MRIKKMNRVYIRRTDTIYLYLNNRHEEKQAFLERFFREENIISYILSTSESK